MAHVNTFEDTASSLKRNYLQIDNNPQPDDNRVGATKDNNQSHGPDTSHVHQRQKQGDHRNDKNPRTTVSKRNQSISNLHWYTGFRSLVQIHFYCWQSDHLPQLPPVGDCALLFCLWDNALTKDTTSSKTKPFKATRLAALERFGDAWIRTLSLELFPLIFGPENHRLIAFLQNHANSNKFFDQVARHYELEKRVCVVPEMIGIGPDHGKGAADVFEGWIASHIIERQFYDLGDPLYEIRKFFQRVVGIAISGFKGVYVSCDYSKEADRYDYRVNFHGEDQLAYWR